MDAVAPKKATKSEKSKKDGDARESSGGFGKAREYTLRS